MFKILSLLKLVKYNKIIEHLNSRVCFYLFCNLFNELQNPEEKYSGKFCECNNFSCDKKDGKICSGMYLLNLDA